MQHLPQPKDQARILKTALKELNLDIKHQDALGVISRVLGHKDWPTLSAALAGEQEAKAEKEKALSVILGPKDGDLYEGRVTVDQTFSADIVVRANSAEEAQELLQQAGHDQYPHGFALDEGNYRGVGDFYLGDRDDIENLSEVEYDRDGDYYGSASWRDERFEYKIVMSRDNPDSADEDDWAQVTVNLIVTNKANVSCEKVISDYDVHRDDLGEWIEECLDNGDFVEDFEKLSVKLKKKLNLK